MFNRKIKFPTDFWEDTQNRLEFIPGKMPPASVKITAVKAFLISNKKLLLVDISSPLSLLGGLCPDQSGHVRQ